MRNKLTYQRKLIYRLERDYGVKVDVYQINSTGHDVKTGAINRTYNKYSLKRGVVLDDRAIRDFQYDISFIRANSNFTYGGFFDHTTRIFLLDRKRLPDDFKPTMNDHIFTKNMRYSVIEYFDLEEQYLIIYKGRQLKGMQSHEIHTPDIESILTLDDSNE